MFCRLHCQIITENQHLTFEQIFKVMSLYLWILCAFKLNSVKINSDQLTYGIITYVILLSKENDHTNLSKIDGILCLHIQKKNFCFKFFLKLLICYQITHYLRWSMRETSLLLPLLFCSPSLWFVVWNWILNQELYFSFFSVLLMNMGNIFNSDK